MESDPATVGNERSEQQPLPPLPQNGPHTLIFQNTSPRMSIPLSLLRLTQGPNPTPEEGSANHRLEAPNHPAPEGNSHHSSPGKSLHHQSPGEISHHRSLGESPHHQSAREVPHNQSPGHGLHELGISSPPIHENDLEADVLVSSLQTPPPPSQVHSTNPHTPPNNDKPQTEGRNPVPYEALVHVLQLLPAEFRMAVVPLVCREWWDAAFDPACWSHVEIGEVRFREGQLEAAREIFWDATPRQIQGLVKKICEKSAGQMQLFRGLVPTTETLFLLAESCPNLKTLLVPRSFRAVNNNALAALARGCPSLTSLDISGCLKVTESGVVQVAAFCKGLRRLSVAGNYQFSNWALISVSMNCRGLVSLDVSGCQRVNDEGLKVLAEKCRGLVSLDVGGCQNITDDGICEIVGKCRHLESIGMNSCKLLTDVSILRIAHNCSKLSTLNVNNVENITDLGLYGLAKRSVPLTDLNLGGCFRITDQAVLAVVRTCPNLSRLSLRGCTRLRDASLSMIAGRQLYYLDVRGCRGMSDSLIRQVMQARNNQKRRLVSSYGL